MTVDEAYKKYIFDPKEKKEKRFKEGNFTDSDIKEIAQGFRKGVLNGKSSYLMCMAVTNPLSGYLSFMGIENEIVKFDIDTSRIKSESCYEVMEHYCIRIGNKILDATADQFRGMPKVFFGPRPIWYAECIE